MRQGSLVRRIERSTGQRMHASAGFVFGHDLDWQASGACVTRERIDAHQADSFFPTGRPLKSTKALCVGCPVREECLAYAMQLDLEGIWGGTTTKEREAMRASEDVEAFIRGGAA